MVKHRCGTCRFFQDANLAGSGWCHHPQRKTTSDLLIMVRRNELACRDEWTHSLWEPGVFGESEVGAPAPSPERRVPPATELEIAALVRTGGFTSSPQDVVLGEARIVSDPGFPPPFGSTVGAVSDPAHGASILDLDTRTAIKRARETYRERTRQLAKAAADPGVDGDPLVAAIEGHHPSAESEGPRDALAQVGPAPAPYPEDKDWIDADPAVAASDSGLPVAIDLSIPAVEQRALPRAASDSEREFVVDISAKDVAEVALPVGSARISRLGEGRDDAEPTASLLDVAVPERSEDPAGPGDTETRVSLSDEWDDDRWVEPLPAPRSPGGAGRWSSEAEPSASASPIRRIESPWSVAKSRGGSWEATEGEDRAGTALNDGAPPVRVARIEPIGERASETSEVGGQAEGPFGDDLPTVEDATEEPVWSRLDTPHFRVGEDVDEPAVSQVADAGGVGPNPSSVFSFAGGSLLSVLASGVPRVCQTCRSYRPGDGGERGWCANRWAFTHRRLVEPEDAQPCETSIGSWWLPADDVCLAAADISTHGQPTPNLDRWLPTIPDRAGATKRRQS